MQASGLDLWEPRIENSSNKVKIQSHCTRWLPAVLGSLVLYLSPLSWGVLEKKVEGVKPSSLSCVSFKQLPPTRDKSRKSHPQNSPSVEDGGGSPKTQQEAGF